MARDSSPDLPQLPSSSPSRNTRSSKPRRPPTVTPKRFNRFFNPSSSSSGTSQAGQALRQLSGSKINGIHRRSETEDAELLIGRPAKRQKFSSPDQENLPLDNDFPSSPPILHMDPPLTNRDSFPQPITRARLARPARSARDTQSSTTGFCTESIDRHYFEDIPGLPFCVAACRTNTLVAVGSEDGSVKILESSDHDLPPFNMTFLEFKAHQNAIMDLAFSSDDLRLATASGDQSAKVIDMKTRETLYVLAGHTSSLKQVAFQPSNDQIIATCSRDSVVALWDLRCASTSPVLSAELPKDLDEAKEGPRAQYPPIYKSIINGHWDLASSKQARSSNGSSVSRPAASVTALAFLPNAPQLFITASDASSRLRIWDIRARLRPTRTRSATSTSTPQPVSTSALFTASLTNTSSSKRSYGITSLAVSTDASRVYAVSRDSSVHVYSGPHLVLGQAATPSAARSSITAESTVPTSSPPTSDPGRPKTGLQGAPPMNVLRHPSLRVGSFYIRAALRPATALRPELLAVGSSDASIVLFPTDCESKPQSALERELGWRPRGCTRNPQGTALIRGHSCEVTGLAWTSDGSVVSCADDYTARVWHENHCRTSHVRRMGEVEGRRWGCGWNEENQRDEGWKQTGWSDYNCASDEDDDSDG